MILEHAVLQILPGREAEFEDAFARARHLIEASPGFGSLRLPPCLEDRSRYLLLVEWERLEDHLDGFRGGPSYPEWKAMLHHFYDPLPEVDHYRTN